MPDGIDEEFEEYYRESWWRGMISEPFGDGPELLSMDMDSFKRALADAFDAGRAAEKKVDMDSPF